MFIYLMHISQIISINIYMYTYLYMIVQKNVELIQKIRTLPVYNTTSNKSKNSSQKSEKGNLIFNCLYFQ